MGIGCLGESPAGPRNPASTPVTEFPHQGPEFFLVKLLVAPHQGHHGFVFGHEQQRLDGQAGRNPQEGADFFDGPGIRGGNLLEFPGGKRRRRRSGLGQF
jgi:hypothetical protein